MEKKDSPSPSVEGGSEMLDKILQTSVSAITVLNAAGDIIYANEAAKDILGLVPSEVTGRAFNDPQWNITRVDGTPFPDEELPFTRVLETGEPVYGVKHAIIWPDGSRRFLIINGAPLLDEHGGVKQVVFSISDITEQVKKEEELRLSEKRFRDVAEASGEYIYELDTEGKYTYVSKRLGEMLKRPVEEIIGKTPFSFMPEKEAQRVADWFGQIVKERKPFTNLEHSSILKDGSIIYQKVSGLPMYDARGNYIGYRGTAADVTEEKKKEAALREESERLEMAISASGIGVWDMDIETGTLTWDDSMLDIYGIPREEFSSAYEVWEKALHPDDRYKAETALQDTMHEFTPFDIQFRIIRQDGEIRYIQALARAYFDEEGNAERIVGTNMDITERLESERALRENEEKLSSLYALAPVAIVLNRKSDGQFIEANPELFRLTGYTEEEYKKLSYWDITPEKFADAEKHQLEELENRGSYGPFEKEYIRKDGNLVPVILQGVLITASDGEEMIWSIVQDISTQKRHEEELQKAKEEAEAANRAKSEFLANMSHEIRTPMNAIIGLSQILLNTDMSRDQEDKLNKIHQSSKMLLGIINDILDFSKIESNKLELELTDFSLGAVVEQLSTLFDEALKEKNLDLFLHVSPDIPRSLIGDPLRIGQVLTNLLSNAVKFTPEGSVKLFVTRAESAEERIEGRARVNFEVKDTGIGMSREQVQRLFTPFSQADSSTTRKYGGSGLGLVISSRIVEEMGGKLNVESVPEKGTVFYFQLDLPLSEQQPSKDESAAASCEMLEKSSILVVDDQEESRIILKEMLESCGMKVELARDGEEGIEKVEKMERDGHPFDFVLMDWKMPRMNGVDASRKIRELSAQGVLKKYTPSILMISAYNFSEKEMRENEDLYFVSKPITASSLFDALLRIQYGEEAATERKEKRETDIIAPSFPGLRVLLVEDNELNQEVAYNLLIRTEADVHMAHNGKEAVSTARERPFDIIFMDLQMPEMDGYEATRIIKSRLPRVPIIALTAAAMNEDRKRVQEEGFSDHLIKPIHSDELYRTMEKYVPQESVSRAEDRDAHHLPLQPNKLPESLPGFDIEEGIKISGGDADFYLKMLLKYREKLNELFRNLLQHIEDSRAEKEPGEDLQKAAAESAHSLKGVAANMSAVKVQDAAAEIEMRIKSGSFPRDREIERLNEAFEEVSSSLGFLKKTSGDKEPAYAENEAGTAGEGEPDSDFIREVYTKLRSGEMLEDEEVETLMRELKGVEVQEKRDRLFEYIDNFMYNESAELLKELVAIEEDE